MGNPGFYCKYILQLSKDQKETVSGKKHQNELKISNKTLHVHFHLNTITFFYFLQYFDLLILQFTGWISNTKSKLFSPKKQGLFLRSDIFHLY